MNAVVCRRLGIMCLIVVALLGACKGEGPTTPAGGSAALTGTAAHGNPIANATVTIRDRNGASRTGTTAANGKYSVDVAGLQGPFLVRVDLGAGASLYSVAGAAGVANVSLYSDLILALWYEVQGKTIATAFASPQANPAPGSAELPLLSGMVEVVVARWLADAGVPASFDLLTSPFDANGTGFDRVLVESTVNAGTGTVTIVDSPSSPTVTQTTTFAVNAGTSSVTVTTTTSAGGTSSSSVVTVVVPGSSAVQLALAGATAALNALAAIVNAKGAALTAADLSGLFDPAFLDNGEDATLGAARFASFLRGSTINSIAIDRILSYDDVAKAISVTGTVTLTQGGVTQPQRLPPMEFRQQGAGPVWALYGNRLPAEGGLQVEWRTDVGPGGTLGPRANINVDVRAPTGALASVTLDGGGIFTNTAIPKSPTVEVVTYNPTPTSTIQVLRDLYFYSVDVPFPPPGTVFTFTLTLATGPVTTFTVTSAASTTDPIVLTSPTGTGLAAANLGQPLAVTWSLPRTFPISAVDFGGQVHTAPPGVSGFECNVQGQLNASATGGTITLPATCQGQAVVEANINVSANGLNGERTHVIHFFQ
jgi:hypothetical protein